MTTWTPADHADVAVECRFKTGGAGMAVYESAPCPTAGALVTLEVVAPAAWAADLDAWLVEGLGVVDGHICNVGLPLATCVDRFLMPIPFQVGDVIQVRIRYAPRSAVIALPVEDVAQVFTPRETTIKCLLISHTKKAALIEEEAHAHAVRARETLQAVVAAAGADAPPEDAVTALRDLARFLGIRRSL